MKLVTYLVKETELTIREQMAASRVGWLQGGWIVDIGFAQEWATLNKGIP
ncbi:fumarylacetoacetate hydrolase family protein, partial [Klebsiella pneumoniae]